MEPPVIQPHSPKPTFPWLVLILTNLASLIVGLAISSFVFKTPTTGSGSNQKLYTNDTYGVTFSYPSNLIVTEKVNDSRQLVTAFSQPDQPALFWLYITTLSTPQDHLYFQDQLVDYSKDYSGQKWGKVSFPDGMFEGGGYISPFYSYITTNESNTTRYRLQYSSPDTENIVLGILPSFKLKNQSKWGKFTN